MRIVIATDTYFPHVNGASYFTQRLAQALQHRQHAVFVIAPARGWRRESYRHQGVTVLGLPSFPTWLKNFRIALPFWLTATARMALREWQPDVVHVQGHFLIGRAVASAAHTQGIPILGTNHFMPENLIHYAPVPGWLRSILRQWMWRDFRRVFERLPMVTTPTATAAALLRENGFSGEVRALSCGIDRGRFHPGQSNQRIQRRYGLPQTPFLLYVGRLDREKNIDFILLALARIPQPQRPHFVIAGQGAEEKNLRQQARALKISAKVTFTGFVANEDLPALYCTADAFIIASAAELQSLVTMEAMASGLPIIAIKAMALPELVRHDENGYLFSGRDTQELAEQIKRLMTDASLRQLMGQRSLTLIQQHDLPVVIEQYEALYQAVVAQQKSTLGVR